MCIRDSLRIGKGVDWEIPSDVSQTYLKQIDSEMKKDVIAPKTKQVERRWVRVYKHNHLCDCECEQVVFAYSVGILGSYTMEEDEESQTEGQK